MGVDWSHKRHWADGWPWWWTAPDGLAYHGRWRPGRDQRARCIHCRRRTFLLDDNGDPSHKTCHEAAMVSTPTTGRRR